MHVDPYIACLSACLLVHSGLVLWTTCMQGVYMTLRSKMEACRCMANNILRPKLEFDKIFQDRVEEVIREKRLKFARATVSSALAIWSLIALLTMLSQRSTDLRRSSSTREIVFVTVYALLLAHRMFPCLLTSRTQTWWYSIFMLGLTICHSPLAIRGRFLFFFQGTQAATLGLLSSLICLNAPWYFFWNLVVNATRAYTLAWHVVDGEGENDSITPTYALENQLIIFVEVCLILFALEMAINADATKQVEVKVRQTQQGALTSLLGIMCEAVVELDSDLLFTDHEPAFAHMLLHGAGKSLHGRMVQEFLPESEDCKLFEQHMRMDNCDASVFHVRVRDAMGNHIKVEFFHVMFEALCGKPHHLLGLREHTDFPKQRKNEGGLVTISEGSGKLHREDEDKPCRVYCEVCGHGQPGSEATVTSGRSSSLSDISTHKTLQVDFVAREPYPILCVSSNFSSGLGEAQPGMPLTLWLPGSGVFFQWIENHIERIFNGGRAPRIEEFGYSFVTPRRNSSSRHQRFTRAGPRMLTARFPDPVRERDENGELLTRATYKVSLRIGVRQDRGVPLQNPGGGGLSTRLSPGGAAIKQSIALGAETPDPERNTVLMESALRASLNMEDFTCPEANVVRHIMSSGTDSDEGHAPAEPAKLQAKKGPRDRGSKPGSIITM